MRRRIRQLLKTGAALAAGAFVSPGELRAQYADLACEASPSFPTVTGSTVTDACVKARDLFVFIAPQVGVAISGGNPIPGAGGTLGGLGKRELSVRLIAVEGWLPRNSLSLNTGGATLGGDFGAARTALPVPAADLALGLYAGVPVGLTNVGGVDLLLGATYLPSASRDAFSFDPQNAGFGYAYGVRVGALQESSIVPGVSVSWQRRQLPKSEFDYTSSDDTLRVSDIEVRSDAIRLVVSKRFAFFGLAAGVGQDRIRSSSSMNAVVNQPVLGNPVRQLVSLTGLRQSVSRNTAFLNASVGILAARVVGEIGWSNAGTSTSISNQFGGRRPNEGYRYGSLGITARF